jgi:hypothetical protein
MNWIGNIIFVITWSKNYTTKKEKFKFWMDRAGLINKLGTNWLITNYALIEKTTRVMAWPSLHCW